MYQKNESKTRAISLQKAYRIEDYLYILPLIFVIIIFSLTNCAESAGNKADAPDGAITEDSAETIDLGEISDDNLVDIESVDDSTELQASSETSSDSTRANRRNSNNNSTVTGPTVTSSTPLDGASDVSLDTSITATLSGQVKVSTLNSGVLLKNAALKTIPATINFNTETGILSITPVYLDYNTSYTITVSPLVTDANGNAAEATEIVFTTENITSVSSILDDAGDNGQFNALTHDSSNNLHIAYKDETNSKLKYMIYNTSTEETVTSDVDTIDNPGTHVSLVLDDSEAAHLSYRRSGTKSLVYATNSQGSFASTVADGSNSGKHTATVINSSDNTDIVYWEKVEGVNSLGYAYGDYQGGFTAESIDTSDVADMGLSMAIDANDNLHVAYQSNTEGDRHLKYAYFNATSQAWSTEIIDETNDDNGIFPVIKLDANENIYIFYQYNTNQLKKLLCTTNASGDWVSSIVFATRENIVSFNPAVSMDENGYFHVSFYDSANNVIRYANNVYGFWATAIAGSAGDYTESLSSIDVANGNVYITYYYREGEEGNLSLFTISDY
ncbi:MAG: Ig-like domain-containing protein [Pseudomonadota bacterium]